MDLDKKNINLVCLKKDDKNILLDFLIKENNSFPVPLNQKININNYADKMLKNANNYAFVVDNTIVGFISFYANDFKMFNAFLTLICVSEEYRKDKSLQLGYKLILIMIEKCKELHMKSIKLETEINNYHAQKFYERLGFEKIIKKNNVYEYELKI